MLNLPEFSETNSPRNSFLKETERNEAIPEVVRQQIERRFCQSSSNNYVFPRVRRQQTLSTANVTSKLPQVRSALKRTQHSLRPVKTEVALSYKVAPLATGSFPKLTRAILSTKKKSKTLVHRTIRAR